MSATTKQATRRALFEAFVNLRRYHWHAGATSARQSDVRMLFLIKARAGTGEGGLSVSDLSHLLHVTSPTVTQWLNDLQSKGWVQRTTDPADRRVVRISLTAAGEQMCERAREAVAESFDGLIDYLGEDETHTLIDLLGKVAEFYRSRDAGCCPEEGS